MAVCVCVQWRSSWSALVAARGHAHCVLYGSPGAPTKKPKASKHTVKRAALRPPKPPGEPQNKNGGKHKRTASLQGRTRMTTTGKRTSGRGPRAASQYGKRSVGANATRWDAGQSEAAARRPMAPSARGPEWPGPATGRHALRRRPQQCTGTAGDPALPGVRPPQGRTPGLRRRLHPGEPAGAAGSGAARAALPARRPQTAWHEGKKHAAPPARPTGPESAQWGVQTSAKPLHELAQDVTPAASHR